MRHHFMGDFVRFLSVIIFFSWSNIAGGESILTAQNVHAPKDSIAIKNDTTEITTLLEQARTATDEKEKLTISRKAFELANEKVPPKYRYRAVTYYAYYLSYDSLDAGLNLLKSGIAGFLNAGLIGEAAISTYDLGIVYEDNGMNDSALAAYGRTYELAKRTGQNILSGDAAYSIAFILNSTARNSEALRWAKRAEERFKVEDDLTGMGMALNQIGIIYDSQGLYSKAVEYYLRAKELAVSAEDIEGAMYLDNNLAIVYLSLKDTVKASAFYKKALDTARLYGFKGSEATFLNNLSEIELSEGDTAAAVAMLKESLKLIAGTIDTCFASYPLEGLGTIFMYKNERDSARHYFSKALQLSIDCDEALIAAGIYNQLGRLYLEEKNPSDAIERFREALDIAEKGLIAEEIKRSLEGLYLAEKSAGNVRQSLERLEAYRSFSDSLNRLNEITKASHISAEYEFKKELAIQEAERKEQERLLNREIEAEERLNDIITWALIVSLFFTAVLVYTYFLIRKKNTKLNQLYADRNKLMGIVAHDLRNPLKNIEGLLKLVEDSDNYKHDPEMAEYMSHIGRTTNKMTDLIDRVTSISAIENMEKNLKKEKVNLRELLVLIKNNFELSAARKKINLKLTADHSRDFFALVDQRYLEQAIDNLVSNAIKFTEEAKEVHLKLKSKDAKHVIEISDQGPGIREEELDRLFKEFTTLHSKPTHDEKSSGLGLYIAHQFIYAMNGVIEVSSDSSSGSTFSVIFEKY
jgi:signal transduction histidine kinase